ncbi:hypothetical protein KSP35_11075 [Aquihabitans sp. G128]|uniref:hypothetical protein n=1 Tax=Aquihabitans sp. G128 TaxID=2849779 RepID=UPI001C22F4C2|nr:hypothetical protein [Aquihabitans sp. G128]QXC63274.1 hypothetical protein KSP35_11075 [Aquihabitans sp. G128]
MSRSPLRRSLGVLAAVVALGAAGCGVSAQDGAGRLSSGSPTATDAPAPAKGSYEGTGGAVSLRKAAAATTELKSQKVAMTMAIEGVPMVGGLEITAKGETDNEAERAHMTLDMGDVFGSLGEGTGSGSTDLPAGAGKVEMVVDGTTVYLRSPLFASLGESSKPWQKIDAEALDEGGALSGSAQTDPGAFLKFLEGAGDVSEVGQEELRGVETTHVKANLDLAKLISEASGAEKDELERQLEQLGGDGAELPTIPAEAWVDGNGYVRKFTMRFDFSSLGTGSEELDGAPMTMSVELYDFDVPVDIAIPPASEVGELDPSILAGGN